MHELYGAPCGMDQWTGHTDEKEVHNQFYTNY
jgi:Glycosyl hydrolases family 38 N-terminal domain